MMCVFSNVYVFFLVKMTNGFVKDVIHKNYFRFVYSDTVSMINIISFSQSIYEAILKRN